MYFLFFVVALDFMDDAALIKAIAQTTHSPLPSAWGKDSDYNGFGGARITM